MSPDLPDLPDPPSPRDVPLSRAEEARLLSAAAAGERRALAEVVERYSPLVNRIARRMHAPGGSEELEDLIQVGSVGLLEAVNRFQPERGAFSSYASVTISGTIKRHFRDRGWRLGIPRSLHDSALAVNSATARLEAQLGRRPTDREVATETGIELERIVETRAAIGAAQPLSLESPGAGEDAATLGEVIGRLDENFEHAEGRSLIGRLASGLDPRDRTVLALRYGLDRTQNEIADAIGVSQMQVSRLLRRAVTRMQGVGEEPTVAETAREPV